MARAGVSWHINVDKTLTQSLLLKTEKDETAFPFSQDKDKLPFWTTGRQFRLAVIVAFVIRIRR
jgi:hypothetical protein